MPDKKSNSTETELAAIADQAALWLARRDRGLRPEEQDEYLRWLASNPRHAEVMLQHAAAFERMMKLYEWQPGQSAATNPDLFAPPRRQKMWFRWGAALAVAASIAIALTLWWPASRPESAAHATVAVLRVNEQQTLSDGSVVELKDGSQIALAFSGQERRVQLTGEAHFTVAKKDIPFVVHAGGVMVRAVGTAFNVRATEDIVDVLVTEGRVALATPELHSSDRFSSATSPLADQADSEGLQSPMTNRHPVLLETFLVAGQQAVVSAVAPAETQIKNVTAEEMEAALAWKAPRLQFVETPLAVAIEEFNRRNRVQLILGQRDLAAIPIGGTFRIDNVDGFVRLLEITLDIRATRRGDQELVLTRGR